MTFSRFADDSQLSKSVFVSGIQTGKGAMLECIADDEVWCRYRGLKLNSYKSEVLWFGTRQQVAKLSLADKKTWFSPLGLCPLQVTRATSA